jgi:hypothetical protein
MTLWFHLKCAAYRRPEPLLETLTASTEQIEHAESLKAICEFASAHRRVPRVGRLERASSGRARCRECRQPIDKDRLRIPLVFYQEGVFDTSGFVHLTCAAAYFGTADLLDCIRHFASDLSEADLLELKGQLN